MRQLHVHQHQAITLPVDGLHRLQPVFGRVDLQAHLGEQGLAAHVASAYDRTAEFHDQIAARPGFRCAYRPQSNILCFRYGDGDQEKLRRPLLAQGRFHIGSTMLGDQRWLRMVVMNDATDAATMEAMLTEIERFGKGLGVG